MTPNRLVAGAAVLAAALAGVLWALWPERPALVPGGGDLGAPVAGMGADLYAEYCAGCHGANLEGQPGWRSPGADGRLPAPPHDETGHTWHHPDDLLFEYTKYGGAAVMAREGIAFDSAMPAFRDRLTDAQIREILAYIKSTWSPRIRAIQAQRTADAAATGQGTE